MGGVFSVIGERQANFTHECFLSMIEIYKEVVRDLLEPAAAVLLAVWRSGRRPRRGCTWRVLAR